MVMGVSSLIKQWAGSEVKEPVVEIVEFRIVIVEMCKTFISQVGWV